MGLDHQHPQGSGGCRQGWVGRGPATQPGVTPPSWLSARRPAPRHHAPALLLRPRQAEIRHHAPGAPARGQHRRHHALRQPDPGKTPAPTRPSGAPAPTQEPSRCFGCASPCLACLRAALVSAAPPCPPCPGRSPCTPTPLCAIECLSLPVSSVSSSACTHEGLCPCFL